MAAQRSFGERVTPEGVPHGFSDDALSRFLRRRPPAQAVAWVETILGCTVTRCQAIRGGSSSAMHSLRVSSPGGARSVILRRYVIAPVIVEEPDIAAREARVLQLLEGIELSTPRLLAVDPVGTDAGVPTILMSRIPGRLDWSPADTATWTRGLASALPEIHAAALRPAYDIPDFAPYAPDSWEPPNWMRRPALWERALDIFHGPPLDPERVFIHRDFHPGNVLWRRMRASGVVDWQAASIGPPSVDVAWCRLNLIGPFGLELADQFVTVWEAVSGRTYHPWAEIVLLVDTMGWARDQHECEALERALGQRLAELRG